MLNQINELDVNLDNSNKIEEGAAVLSGQALSPSPNRAAVWNDGLSGSRALPAHHRRFRRETVESWLSALVMAGDLTVIVLAFLLGFWMRFYSGLMAAELPPPLIAYSGLIFFGVLTIYAGFLSRKLHDHGCLLQLPRTMGKIVVVSAVCGFLFTGFSLLVKTNPGVSRMFVLFTVLNIIALSWVWRLALKRLAMSSWLMSCLRQRVAVVGWSPETDRLQQELGKSESLYEFVGWVQTGAVPASEQPAMPALGDVTELAKLIRQHHVEVMIHADREMGRSGILHLAKICEMEHVQFKLVPRFFESLLSGLRPGQIGGVPILGVEDLPLSRLENRVVKRAVDIVGSLVGLTFGMPLMAVCGWLVRRESKGPILFAQVRAGCNGREFHIYKIRSMKMDAEASTGARWATENDDRRLKIGAFMRRYNIDEIPQFWNVLTGTMSLVGPRPERPELIEKFKCEIPHYQLRHVCKPGMTGWAQVNGWRGNTDLTERIRCDIWYAENWSLWLDFRIMLMTFFHRDNAY